MSHAVKVGLPGMKDIEFLKRAFQRSKWTIKENRRPRAYYAARQFPWVAVNPNNEHGYDLGISRNSNGMLELEGDVSMLDEEAKRVLGNNFDILKQNYMLESVLADAVLHGAQVTETMLPNQVIELEIETMEGF